MLVKPETQELVLNLSNPDRVLAVIPSAKTMEYKGSTLVVVPHRDEEVRVLGNIGIEAPMPIEHYYSWPGEYPPFENQKATSAFLTRHHRSFCLNEMGTGKTYSVLWAYDYLRSIGVAHRMIVVSPLSTLEETWANTIFRGFPHLTFAVLYGTRARREKLLEQEVDIYIINPDGLKIVAELIANRDDIDVVTIDEIAQAARNKSTDRWKALRMLVPHPTRICWGLTGTPTPTEPTDAWAQCLLINPDTVPKYYTAFRDLTMRVIGPHRREPRPNAARIVAKAMQPAIRFKRAECVDLPPVMYETRSAELTPAQRDAYKLMLTKLKAEVEGGQITAANEAIKVMKLVQIACGAAYTDTGDTVFIPAANRLRLTEEIIEAAGSKVIVFVPFTGALEAVAAHLRKTYTVEVIRGATSKSERDRIIREFQHGAEPEVLVAQASAMSHGLTLTAASVVVWFAPPNSLEVYEQACARITRPGQKLSQLIVNVEGTPAERRIYERLQSRGRMQGLLLDLVEEGV
jgi:SNF2 family DNA or RNA helicase